MPEALTISTRKPEAKALDYEMLRSTAIGHLEQTASKIWTDYNVHDPGITSLELLCYAITDLAYRTSQPVPDLLTDEKSDPAVVISHFHTAKKILPNRPVTINDYRKMLAGMKLDNEEKEGGIKNVWLKKTTKTLFADLVDNKLLHKKPAAHRHDTVSVKGYYEVLLEYDVAVKTKKRKNQIIEQCRQALQANRNLCEDFADIKEVDRQPFRLCSEIEIKPSADPVEVLAKIFLNVQLYLNPLIRFYTLKEMLDAGIPPDKIFEGPIPAKGFIKEEELVHSELKKEIHLSDIMKEILKVDEVININDIIFNPSDQATELENKWVVPVKDGFQPLADLVTSNVLIYKNGMPFRPAMEKVIPLYEKMLAEVLAANDAKTSEDIKFNTGKFRSPSQYLPLRFHFPKTYGIGQWGLPENAPLQRKIQATQLKGYLWFFDQLLANYLSQLANVRQLFATKENITQTYFTQLADEFAEYETKPDTEIAKETIKRLYTDKTNLPAKLQSESETTDQFHRRRNLFLDHLLSRFAESFFDYVSILQSVFPETTPQEIIQNKIDFLKEYPACSSERFLGYRYEDAENLWDTANISGLEKRLQHLLGIKNINRRNLVTLFSSIAEEDDGSGNKKFRFVLTNKQSGKRVLVSKETFDNKETCEGELEVAFLLAGNADNYSIETDGGKFEYRLTDKVNKLIAVSGDQFNSKNAASNALKKFIDLFSAQSDEGIFLIEHLLLFPEKTESFLPICTDPDCDDCADTDPYSFRISFILPAYAPRFLKMDFRNYCERVIRLETPAHLFPKICWVNNEQLHLLEEVYREWLQVKAGEKDDPGGKILQQLVTTLTTLKSIYPPSTLQDCSSTEERKLFLLNQHSLGTLKS